tara:strand:+ start:87 stop:560 length:474 start_codon:yes stop_codon:yes gene_type:complete
MSELDQSKKYFEDFSEGFVFEYQVPGLSVEEITDFALQYDPQPFHLDETAASETHFGGLVASGFQTQLKCFGPFCREVLLNSGSVGAPGIDNLKWLRPWFPNVLLEVSAKLIRKRVSSKLTGLGYINFELEALADGAPLLTMEWAVIMLTRGTPSID